MINAETTLGGCDYRVSTEDGPLNDSLCEWGTGVVGASGDGSEMFDPYYSEDYDMDPELGASDGKGFGKGGQKGGRGPTGGRGGRGFTGRPQAAGFKTLKLSAEGTKVAFDSLPNVVDANGNVLGVMCLRFCCRNGCTSDPQHPRHRVGEMCHKVHSLEFEASFV